MTRVMVEHPIAEAEALLKRLGPDGVSMSAEECDLAEAARQRVTQAVRVERGTGGDADQTVIQQARDYVGCAVVLHLGTRGRKEGTLQRINVSSTLILHDGIVRQPVPTSMVESIELAPEEQVAA